MAVNIPKVGAAQLYAYRYDQLNRIVAMNAYTGLNETTNEWGLLTTSNYQERISYDANGNILTYNRNGNQGTAMDILTYQYPKYANTQPNIDARRVGKMINNRLRYVLDEATSNYADDIKSNAPLTITTRQNVKDELAAGQGSDNYAYDEIGNLIKDTKEGITNITWNVYGKIQSINKGGNIIAYTYDASGNRISKTAAGKTTIYVRDASGNVMSVYTADPAINSGNLMQNEVHLYGSSRLGIYNINRNVQTLGIANYLNNINTFTRGNKFFELSNHLGNVLVTISDKKIGVDANSDGYIDYYNADVITANDFYPGGMTMPGRKYSQANTKYRYGFNGKENDNEVKGEGNQQDYGFRIYDPRLGRFLSVDPLTQEYPELTPYQFASNTPIWAIDIDGLEGGIASPMGGQNVVDAQTAKDYNAGKSWFSQPASRWMKLGLAAQMNAIQPTPVYTENSYPNMTKGQYVFASMSQSQINNSQSSRSFSSRSSRVPQQPHAEAEVTVAKPKLNVPTSEDVPVIANKQTTAANNTQPVISNTATAVEEYEVGPFNVLRKKSVVGDELDLHHFPAKNAAKQVIPGYNPNTGNAIAIPENIHENIPTQKGVYTGTARGLLSTDANNARKAGFPGAVVQEAVNKAKAQHPAAYIKKKK